MNKPSPVYCKGGCGYEEHCCHCENPNKDYEDFIARDFPKWNGRGNRNFSSVDLKNAFLSGCDTGTQYRR